MQVKVRYNSGTPAKGIKVKVGGYEGRTDKDGIVNLDISSRETRKVFVDGKLRGEEPTPKDLSYTI